MFQTISSMENRINLSPAANGYLQHFQIAQMNLSRIINEERLRKRLQKSRKEPLSDREGARAPG